MSKTTITFALDGEIVLSEFSQALKNFDQLINQLSKEVGNAKFDWSIEELYSGSAIATFRGIFEDEKVIGSVIDAYEEVGEALQNGKDIPYSSLVRNYAYEITGLINGRINSVRFETEEKDFIISQKSSTEFEKPIIRYSLGSVKGEIQTLSKRKQLFFTLWDSLFDKPVNCYFQRDQEERMRDAWGKRAVISGKIGRQSQTGKPVVVRDVTEIRTLEPANFGDYTKAKGILHWEDEELPENAIRRLRNA